MNLPRSLAVALEQLDDRKWRSHERGGPPLAALTALVGRGLAESAERGVPGCRYAIVGRLTDAGVAERDRRRPVSASTDEIREAVLVVRAVLRDAPSGPVARETVRAAVRQLAALERIAFLAAKDPPNGGGGRDRSRRS